MFRCKANTRRQIDSMEKSVVERALAQHRNAIHCS